MADIGERIQQADWKKEKHVPVIECPETVRAGEALQVQVSVGKEIAHPNTTEHHIRWIALFFHPAGANYTYQVGRYEFTAHGESPAGADEGPVHADPFISVALKTAAGGTLHAVAYCNIHGLWESSREIAVG